MIDGLDTMMVAAGLAVQWLARFSDTFSGPKGQAIQPRFYSKTDEHLEHQRRVVQHSLTQEKRGFARTELEQVKEYINERVSERKQLADNKTTFFNKYRK